MHKVLFAASEAHPLAKTGGLGEVCGALPVALARMDNDVRVALPGYRTVLEASTTVGVLARLDIPGCIEPIRILESTLGATAVPLYIVDAPGLFDRPGGFYLAPDGKDWPDNANRFAAFCRAIVEMAMDRVDLNWQPDVVHGHDWQTGLAVALLARERQRPGIVFTVHNIAYTGTCDRARFETLELPLDLFTPDAMEFYGQFALIKGGLVYADVITTVSPTYAKEIQTPVQGCGFDGLMRHRANDLVGIVNGVDYTLWDPATDAHLTVHYGARTLDDKVYSKRALQRELNLEVRDDVLLLGVVSRLAYQKGIDLLPEALAPLWGEGVQLAVLGAGDADIQARIERLAKAHPRACAVRIGYDDALSHRIIAGADAFLMPSRYEPCGLGQLYSQRYGTVPVVRHTGGLTDTVIPANAETLAAGVATGVVYHEDSAAALSAAVSATLHLHRAPVHWRRVQMSGMQRDFSWTQSARAYAEVYRRARLQRR
jgi:starch synthase